MMLNLGEAATEQERRWLRPRLWYGPSALAAILLAELLYVLASGSAHGGESHVIDSKQVGMALFGPYLLAVELAAMLLLAGMVGAYHLGQRERKEEG